MANELFFDWSTDKSNNLYFTHVQLRAPFVLIKTSFLENITDLIKGHRNFLMTVHRLPILIIFSINDVVNVSESQNAGVLENVFDGRIFLQSARSITIRDSRPVINFNEARAIGLKM